MSKKNIFKSLLMVGALMLAACNPFKVTDPSDPKFNPNEFVFNDYRNNTELAEALKILVPVGTSRQTAEKFLDGSPDKRGGKDLTNSPYLFGGATIRKKIDVNALKTQSSKIILYGHGGKRKLMNPVGGGWAVIVFYDKNDRVLQIVIRNEVLFSAGVK